MQIPLKIRIWPQDTHIEQPILSILSTTDKNVYLANISPFITLCIHFWPALYFLLNLTYHDDKYPMEKDATKSK